MKAVILAFLFLIGVDVVANHGAGCRRVIAGVQGFGDAIGAWVYYS